MLYLERHFSLERTRLKVKERGEDCPAIDFLCLPREGGNGRIPHISMCIGASVAAIMGGKRGLRRVFYLISLFFKNNTSTCMSYCMYARQWELCVSVYTVCVSAFLDFEQVVKIT